MTLTVPARASTRTARLLYQRRSVSTLAGNRHIYIFPSSDGRSSTLSLLPTSPPNPNLALGTSTTTPPTPSTFTENPHIFPVLHEVLQTHAVKDPEVVRQAQAFASNAGANLGSGGVFFPQTQQRRDATLDKRRRRAGMVSGDAGAEKVSGDGGGDGRAGSPGPGNPTGTGGGRVVGGSDAGDAGGSGAGGASAQGGMGGAGCGGWVHVSDTRNPPDWGRVAWPEDIFGSVQVDGNGAFVGETGNYQSSGTYRICTNEGVLGLSGFLRDKLVARLKELEKTI